MPPGEKPRLLVSDLFAHHFGVDADPNIATPVEPRPLPGAAAERLCERIVASHAEPALARPTMATGETEETLLTRKKPRRIVIIER